MWVEKYRPQKIENCVGLPHEVNSLNANLGPLLLHGPSGTGKTTLAHCLARERSFSGMVVTSVLELNASDTRTLSDVLLKIRSYAQGIRTKVLILDECDSMAPDAQHALSAVIELYAKNTWFILTCNSLSLISPELKSRCYQLYLPLLTTDLIRPRLQHIAHLERLTCTCSEADLESIMEQSCGDLRKAITMLQSQHFLSRELSTAARECWTMLLRSTVPFILLLQLVDVLYEGGYDIVEWIEALTLTYPDFEEILKQKRFQGIITVLSQSYTKFFPAHVSTRLQFHGLISRLVQSCSFSSSSSLSSS